MLYELEPDESLTGGFAYTDKVFDSTFVETLLAACAWRWLPPNAPLTYGAPRAGVGSQATP